MRRSKSEAHELDPLPHGWEDDRKPAPLHAAVLEYCRENASMRGASSTDIERSWLKIWPTLEDAGITEAFQIETAVGRRTVLETLTKFTTNNPTEMGGTPAVVARRLSDLKKCLKGAGVSQKSLETLATAWSSKGRKGRGHSITHQWAKATGWVEEGSTGYSLEDAAALLKALDEWADGTRPRSEIDEHLDGKMGATPGQIARLRAFAWLAIPAGLRISEAVSITREGLTESEFAAVESKGREIPRKFTRPIIKEARAALNAWLEIYDQKPRDDGQLFASVDVMARVLRAAMKGAGLPPMSTTATGRQTWGLHGFRHTFATDRIEQGATGAQVSAALRHNNPASLQPYIDQGAKARIGHEQTLAHAERLSEQMESILGPVDWDGTLSMAHYRAVQRGQVQAPPHPSFFGEGKVTLRDGTVGYLSEPFTSDHGKEVQGLGMVDGWMSMLHSYPDTDLKLRDMTSDDEWSINTPIPDDFVETEAYEWFESQVLGVVFVGTRDGMPCLIATVGLDGDACLTFSKHQKAAQRAEEWRRLQDSNLRPVD